MYGCTGKGGEGWGGGAYRETGTEKIEEGNRASTKARYPGQRLPTRRGTPDQEGTAGTQEVNRASGVGMHLSVSW